MKQFVLQILCLLIGSLSISSVSLAGPVPSFELDGTLLASDGVSPLLDTSIRMKIQILNPDQDCALYDESQMINTQTSKGAFNLQVGSAVGAIKRSTLDSANTMTQVFSNQFRQVVIERQSMHLHSRIGWGTLFESHCHFNQRQH